MMAGGSQRDWLEKTRLDNKQIKDQFGLSETTTLQKAIIITYVIIYMYFTGYKIVNVFL